VCYKDDVTVNFEPPTYTLNPINGQNGWSDTGGYVSTVVTTPTTFHTLGKQSLRLTDSVTSDSFGDQTFAPSLKDSVGDTSATNGSNAFITGTKYRNFEMQFDLASVTPTVAQQGLHLSVSPDRCDGSRMSYLRFTDNATGIVVMFDDVQGILPAGDPNCSGGPCANFVETIVTTLIRSSVHTIKLTLYTPDGASNDVVKLYIDGKLVHTGTSWEDYYRYDVESSAEQSTRIVKTVLFRESGEAIPGQANGGYLIDNLIMGAY